MSAELKAAKVRAREVLGEAVAWPPVCTLVEVGRRESEGLDLFGAHASMTPKGFPLPALILFCFTKLLEFEVNGPEEGVRWSIRFEFRGACFGFDQRKFGLRFLCEPARLDTSTTAEVLARVRTLTKIAEDYLTKAHVPEQLKLGAVTVKNMYEALDFRYRYLRESACKAYAEDPPPPRKVRGGTIHVPGLPKLRGSALATACVEAYFSRVEHFFVLALAFVTDTVERGDLLAFLRSSWRKKACAILPHAKDPTAKRLYDALLALRIEWRNPLAHGGFLSEGGSLYVHVPGVAALPAKLTRTPDGVGMDFFLRSSSFDEVMALLDEFDGFLEEGSLRHAVAWAKSGLPVVLDEESRNEYREATKSEDEFNALIERTGYEIDRHYNMYY